MRGRDLLLLRAPADPRRVPRLRFHHHHHRPLRPERRELPDPEQDRGRPTGRHDNSLGRDWRLAPAGHGERGREHLAREGRGGEEAGWKAEGARDNLRLHPHGAVCRREARRDGHRLRGDHEGPQHVSGALETEDSRRPRGRDPAYQGPARGRDREGVDGGRSAQQRPGQHALHPEREEAPPGHPDHHRRPRRVARRDCAKRRGRRGRSHPP